MFKQNALQNSYTSLIINQRIRLSMQGHLSGAGVASHVAAILQRTKNKVVK